MNSFVIYNAEIVDSNGERHGWIAVTDDQISAAGCGDVPAEILASSSQNIDAEGAFLIPGLADTHVHFREPGLTQKADMKSESLAAVAGGITTVFDMPNTVPSTITAEALADKMRLTQADGIACHITPLLGLAPGKAMEALSKIDVENTPAVKLFLGTTTGAMAAPEGSELNDVFRFCADHRLRIIVHAEDNEIIARNTADAIAKYGSAESVPVSMHSIIRSREACLRSSAHAVELAHRFGTPLHLAHVSTADEVRELLSAGPTTGKLVTAETTPLYIDPIISDPANRTSLLKVNPAIKTVADGEALREALFNGAIDTIGTDHAPHQRQEKLLPGITAMSGAPSIQFALPLMLSYLPLAKIVEKMTVGPKAVFGIDIPTTLTTGARADFALIRKVPEYTITDADVLSKCAWTPFAGRKAHHKVVATYVSGKQVILNISK